MLWHNAVPHGLSRRNHSCLDTFHTLLITNILSPLEAFEIRVKERGYFLYICMIDIEAL